MRVRGATVGIAASFPLVALLILVSGAPASAAQTDFPDGYTGYHTYAEMTADLDSVVADHPHIASKFSIGQSYEGREIWALKISDNVGTDENEPEILFEALHHAREHLVVEMSLYAIHLLTDNYRANPGNALEQRVSDIVDSREIFIIPMVNPDGAEYDISGGTFQYWRKNRQPIPNSTEIGIDLNRNWGYKWGCCQGSSGDPSKITYRGPSPWFAPEVVALRDFVNSRIVNGRQQITEAVSWHTNGEYVMWPYAYTYTDLPRSMTADDLAALSSIGHGMADLNGYTPQQMSDLYIFDGASSDWLYHEQRIMALTIEMYPPEHSDLGGFYPPDDVIATQTSRNQEAVLWLLEQADCPYRSAGLPADCGPLYDDFEAGRGWTVNASGADTATGGAWERGTPQKTKNGGGVKQILLPQSGEAELVTGAAAGAAVGANDVDGGTTSVRSPQFKLGASGSTGWTLSFSYTFAHNAKARPVDFLSISVAGVSTPLFIQNGFAGNRNAVWTPVTVGLDAWAGQQIRLLITARDGGADSLIEAAIDDVRVYQAP
jgi:carboxypeptidase T